jgi:glutamyl-Q tRNA(Asp) synthetase
VLRVKGGAQWLEMYRGRFAPSPTGPLHLGSLAAAAASWLDARAHRGQWLVRIEDVDEPRCRGQWQDSILRTLDRLGFAWDGAVMVQSARKDAYRAALESLQRNGMAYGCACSRRQAGDGAYPGTCREGLPAGRFPRAWRMRVDGGPVEFEDRWQGACRQDVLREVGDFVLLRADGYFAYQLAVVVDDGAQRITDVVRGADLLDSTPRQLLLQRALGLEPPRYMHHPVMLGSDGRKLSKQTRAAPVDEMRGEQAVAFALRFLGLQSARLDEAVEEWRTQWAINP